MNKKKFVSALLTLVMVCTLLPADFTMTKAAATSDPGRRVVGYLPSYRNYTINSIDFSALTHCNLSFMTYSNGTLTSGFSASDVQTIVSKCHANGVKALIAVGGWNGFDTSDGPFTTAEKRTSFVNQLMDYVNTYNLDGVDLDLEVTDSGVWNNFDALVSELSSRLKANGKLLTMAVSTWFTGSIQNTTYQYFDFLNLMSYDYNQSGTGEVAPWSQIYDMISYYGSRGVSNDRLVIGVPFYGYGSGGTAYTYAQMVEANTANANLDFANGVYYNGMNTIRQKAEYSKSYGGTMIWEIGQDSYTSYSLLGVIKDVMSSGTTQPSVTDASTTETSSIPSGFIRAVQNEWAASGNWGCYFGNWSGSAMGAYSDGTPYKVYIENANVGVPWLVQARYDANVTAGHTYKVTVNITSDKAGSIGIKEDISNEATPQVYSDIKAGSNTITATYDVTSDQMRIMFELGNGIESGTTLTFNSITIEDITSPETTPSTTQPPTSPQPSGSGPIEVIGQVISSSSNNTITVVWGQTSEQLANGQKYNVYVDGILKLSSVDCAEYNISDIAGGNHTVKITAVLNGLESIGVTGEVNVLGGVVEESTTPTPTIEEVASNILINGYQISTIAEGYRVIYSVDNSDSDVENFGLVYGLAGTSDVNDIIVGSSNSQVYNYQATDAGKTDKNYSGKDGFESYVMTMEFVKTAEFYNSEIYVRAYAKMKNGTYHYSAVETVKVYDIADILYCNNLMSNASGHNYLYDNILSVVNSSYNKIEFDYRKIVVK